ncbi:MAG: acyl-CoA dehydratase activase [Dehalococcoidales bacterium]|nr:acyl-CoA dehydratase activase [Dehalococcoidales bacterium]
MDVGSSTSKAVILKESRILSYSIVSTGAESAGSAERAMAQALKSADCLSLKDIGWVIATGYGRIIVPFANETVTEISCHARGANWLFPSVRTVLDMGGQDCKAIRCDAQGKLLNFVMNDKCAAGTGRFLEVMSQVMEIPLEDIGPLSLQAKEEIRINSTCTVFGKSEVASLIRQGKDKRDILAGLHTVIVTRVYTLLRKVGIQPALAITGGIAKNIGVVRRLEERVGLNALLPEEPQIVGALGAALFAQDKLAKQ